MLKKYIYIFFGSIFLSFCSAQIISDVIFQSDEYQDGSISEDNQKSLGLYAYNLQIQIGLHQIDGAMPLIQQEAFILLSRADDLLSYSLIQTMRSSGNKSEIYNQYISSLEQFLYKVNAFQSQLQSEMLFLDSKVASCTHDQEVSNQLYQSALMNTSTTNLDILVKNIQLAASCLAENQSLLESKQAIYDLIYDRSVLISDKYAYLTANKTAILDNFSLLDATYLEEVVELQKELKKY